MGLGSFFREIGRIGKDIVNPSHNTHYNRKRDELNLAEAGREKARVDAQNAFNRQIADMAAQTTSYQKELDGHFADTQKKTGEGKRRVLGARPRGDVFDDVYSHKSDLPFRLGGD